MVKKDPKNEPNLEIARVSAISGPNRLTIWPIIGARYRLPRRLPSKAAGEDSIPPKMPPLEEIPPPKILKNFSKEKFSKLKIF